MVAKDNKIYSCYFPTIGGVSSVLFSANVMNPAGFAKLFSPFEQAVANALWFNSHIGIGLYLYHRPHMRPNCEWRRVGYSVFGSVLFNFGSVLLLATLKKLLPDDNIARVMVGVVTATGLVCVGKEYVKMIDEGARD